MQVSLKPHTSSPPTPITQISVQVWRQVDRLSLFYRLEGDLDAVRWPLLRPHGPADELWRTTCLEAFVQPTSDRRYVELNFSHSNEWAAYAFATTREGMRTLERVDVRHWVWPDPDERDYAVGIGFEETFVAAQPWRLGLSAVIEAIDGTISYWALAHPSDKPDFHHPDSFVLELP